MSERGAITLKIASLEHRLCFSSTTHSEEGTGCKEWLAVQNNAAIMSGQVWRLATCAFLHSGLLHIGMNCYSLNSLGPMMERTSNHRRFGVVYAAGALGCSLLSFFKSPVNSLGASGTIPLLLRHWRLF